MVSQPTVAISRAEQGGRSPYLVVKVNVGLNTGDCKVVIIKCTTLEKAVTL